MIVQFTGNNDEQIAARQRAKFLLLIENTLAVAGNTRKGDLSPELEKYFVSSKDKPLLDKKAISPAAPRPFSALNDARRRIFTVELPDALHKRIRLDESAMDEFTRSAMSDFYTNTHEYNMAVSRKAQNRDSRTIAALDERSSRIYERLFCSAIEKPFAPIPLVVGNKNMTALNSEYKVAATLMALQLTKDGVTDDSERSCAQRNFIRSHLGTTQEMPINILRNIGGANPTLAAECDRAFAECLPTLETAIIENARPLQMLALQGDEPFAYKAAAGAKKLLAYTGQPLLPAKLETDEECTFVMRKLISGYSPAESKAAQAMYEGYRKATEESYHPLPEVKPWNSKQTKPDEHYAALFALAEAYLKHRSPSLPHRPESGTTIRTR